MNCLRVRSSLLNLVGLNENMGEEFAKTSRKCDLKVKNLIFSVHQSRESSLKLYKAKDFAIKYKEIDKVNF
jgi:hypothetical protein